MVCYNKLPDWFKTTHFMTITFCKSACISLVTRFKTVQTFFAFSSPCLCLPPFSKFGMIFSVSHFYFLCLIHTLHGHYLLVSATVLKQNSTVGYQKQLSLLTILEKRNSRSMCQLFPLRAERDRSVSGPSLIVQSFMNYLQYSLA